MSGSQDPIEESHTDHPVTRSRYVAIRAELEKAELERAALFDALRETRVTLDDVRRQRDDAQQEVKTLRGAPAGSVGLRSASMRREAILTGSFDRQAAGGEPDGDVWRERAQQALFDVEILRHELMESKAREAALRRRGSASERGGPTRRASGVGSYASASDPEENAAVSPPRIPFPSMGSPTLVMSDTSLSALVDRSKKDPAAAPREVKESFGSSLDSEYGGVSHRLSALANGAGGMVASPLMGQTMPVASAARRGRGGGGGGGGREGPKSSYGSSEASPLKRRNGAEAGELGGGDGAASSIMGRSFTALGFPGAAKSTASAAAPPPLYSGSGAQCGVLIEPRRPKTSLGTIGTVDSSDWDGGAAGDRSLDDSVLSGAGAAAAGLRRRDEEFLADLTTSTMTASTAREGQERMRNGADWSPEEARGHKVLGAALGPAMLATQVGV